MHFRLHLTRSLGSSVQFLGVIMLMMNGRGASSSWRSKPHPSSSPRFKLTCRTSLTSRSPSQRYPLNPASFQAFQKSARSNSRSWVDMAHRSVVVIYTTPCSLLPGSRYTSSLPNNIQKNYMNSAKGKDSPQDFSVLTAYLEGGMHWRWR